MLNKKHSILFIPLLLTLNGCMTSITNYDRSAWDEETRNNARIENKIYSKKLEGKKLESNPDIVEYTATCFEPEISIVFYCSTNGFGCAKNQEDVVKGSYNRESHAAIFDSRLCKPLAMKASWEKVNKNSSEDSLERFINEFGDSKYAAIALKRLEPIKWQKVKTSNSLQTLDTYLSTFPDSKNRKAAMQLRDPLHWQTALKENTFKSYQSYINENPNGKFVKEATNRSDSIFWQAATNKGSVESYSQYLKKFPDGKFQKKASELHEAKLWKRAASEESLKAIDSYLSEYPSGRYVSKANKLKSELPNIDWEALEFINRMFSQYTFERKAFNLEPKGKNLQIQHGQAIYKIPFSDLNPEIMFEKSDRLLPSTSMMSFDTAAKVSFCAKHRKTFNNKSRCVFGYVGTTVNDRELTRIAKAYYYFAESAGSKKSRF